MEQSVAVVNTDSEPNLLESLSNGDAMSCLSVPLILHSKTEFINVLVS